MIVERDNIGIFGKMNSGKSSIMNLLTQANTSIVDATAGTTADTKLALLEIHGVGPVKLFDTAGLDERGALGEKKKEKAYNDLKECDLALIVIDPSTKEFDAEKDLIETARDLDKQILLIYNIFSDDDKKYISFIESNFLSQFYKSIIIKADDLNYRVNLVDFIINNYESKNIKLELLPFIEKDEYYILNIPMDDETPQGRFLRPQAMTEEYITRKFAYSVSFRMNLTKARSETKFESDEEKKRFMDFISNFKKRPKAIITDSQAMDIMNLWAPSDIMLTTFSITMINYFSKGKLNLFVEGIKPLKILKPCDKVLIVEACNHSRIGEDIGTVQIPNYFKKHLPGVIIEHNFGREFQENKSLEKYKLIIHCGGCMISSQKLSARIRDLSNLGVPFTNYGVFLSYIQGKDALMKVLKPWNLNI